MLERFAAQVLNKYIGRYVENFNPQNLSIGIVQGAVELENLQIRKDALKEFDLPGVGVKWGYIGKITLRIPSYRNYSEPWVIDINQLYLIVGPCANDDASYDEKMEQLLKKERKEQRLAQLEEKWHASQGSSKSFYAVWRAYSSSIVTNIVENIQIRLFDLHIRYEDNSTLSDNSFAFGMHISDICTETTDETWNPIQSSKANADKKWKKMDLKELSFYWDTETTTFDGKSQAELLISMASCVNSDEDVTDSNRFLLRPASGEARLTRNCSAHPLRSRNLPRLTLDVDLPEIALSLTKAQYNQLLVLSGEIARWDSQKQHKSGRPTESPRENPRAWWSWAIKKNLQKIQLRRKQRSMAFAANRAMNVVKYIKLYKAFLIAKYLTKSQGAKDKKVDPFIEEIRNELTFPELAILHELAYAQLERESAQRKQRKPATPVQQTRQPVPLALSPATDNLQQKSRRKTIAAKIKKGSSKLRSRSPQKKKQNWKWGGWLGKWRSHSPSDPESSDTGNSEDTVDPDELLLSPSPSRTPSRSPSREQSPSPKDDMFYTPEGSTEPDSLFKDLNDDELYEMFGDELNEEDTTDTFLKRDSVLLKLNFSLNSGKFRLLDHKNLGLVALEFKNVDFKSEWRPRYRTHEIKLDLESIILRDLNPLNAYFSNLITPSTRSSTRSNLNRPLFIFSSDSKLRKKHLDSSHSSASLKLNENPSEKWQHPVLSITYEKLPHTRQFSDRLEIVTAPLCLTFVPGLTDKLKQFFQTSERFSKKGMKSEVLTQGAKQRYDLWMKQTRDEVKRTVDRLIEGKDTAITVNKRKWAFSFDIFAPDIIIPEDWSASKSSMVVLSLGHMTFANHTGDLNPRRLAQRAPGDYSAVSLKENVDSEDDDDEYLTPCTTPPTEPQESGASEMSYPPSITDHFINQDTLTEKMLWDKMYEQYHVTFADLQVLVLPNRRKWDAQRLGTRTPMHLVERFTVDLTLERRIVPTTDPNYPALTMTGNLPHLTLHISHKKIHTVLSCIAQLEKNYKPTNTTPSRRSGAKSSPSKPRSAKSKEDRPKSSKSHSAGKANSKKMTCDFLVNQISVVLEDEKESQILSVLEVSRIQTKFVKKPYDSTLSFSIYSLLLVDVMQQLGHDYELLLASHRRVFMDVDSGNILDSGSASPEDPISPLPFPSKTPAAKTAPKRSVSETKVGNPITSNVLNAVSEDLRQFAKFSDKYFSPRRSDFVAGPKKSTPTANDDSFHYLITLEIKTIQKGSDQDHKDAGSSGSIPPGASSTSPCTDIKANFSNLDVVFNAESWITILNFIHKLNPSYLINKRENTRVDDSVGLDSSLDERLLKPKESTMDILMRSRMEDRQEEGKTLVSIDFQKLNILLMRHINKFDKKIGRKVATVTMQGANVLATVMPKSSQGSGSSPAEKHKLHVSGSIASLQLNDLTSANNTMLGYEVLSVGDYRAPTSTRSSDKQGKVPDVDDRAFFFDFKQDHPTAVASKGADVDNPLNPAPSISVPAMPSFVYSEPSADNNLSDTMLFAMDSECNRSTQFATGLKRESRADLRLASTCYIHSPRLIAELLTVSDEVNDFVRQQMTTATRQAYKDMARSIMEKVTDYSKSVLGRGTDEGADGSLSQGVSTLGLPNTVDSGPSLKTFFSLQIKMQSPILAFPKSPGSFELLIANLGQITVRNEDRGTGEPMDVLHIGVENMNLRIERRRDEELEMKRSSANSTKGNALSGPSILKLKKDSILFMNSLDDLSSDKANFGQILHKTFLHLTVERRNFTPSTKSSLDVRRCCNKEDIDHCSSNRSCAYYSSHVGAIAERKMYVNVYAASALTLTLSKQAYEQLLKTLDNISYGDDIDVVSDYLFNTLRTEESSSALHHSSSAPDIGMKPPTKINKPAPTIQDVSSASSYQSTPRHDKESALFDIPDHEIPLQGSMIGSQQNVTTRRYTPISADINIPCLIFQLSGDLSEGEQGIVKVTLERFASAYRKENRFATQIDLSLGSLDIEDLLKHEQSLDRHIVVSYSGSKKNTNSKSLKTVYLSSSCPAFIKSSTSPGCHMSASLPSFQQAQIAPRKLPTTKQSGGLFRPYESLHVSDSYKTSSKSQPLSPRTPEKQSRKSPVPDQPIPDDDSTLVKITAFLVDGNSAAYSNVYDRVNRHINIDFNSLDCKVNLQTWVVLLDFFGIGTSPKKQYQVDPKTEKSFTANQQLDLRSFYENQPDKSINSEISFIVRSFALTFNKQEYELLKANVARLQSHIQLRDGMLRVRGQLGDLSVSDLSPNGALYRERFMFTGDKALDFDIKKYDEYDSKLQRDYDISVRLRMSSIRYVHTQRFQNETVAFCQHFQQLQEVLGRMRAASVGQSIHLTSRRQARVMMDVEADAPIILIPESSHSKRLIVADLGHITVSNEFKNDGTTGTLSYQESMASVLTSDSRRNYDDFQVQLDDEDEEFSPRPNSCLLDVIHVNLIDMDLFTATYSRVIQTPTESVANDDLMKLVFPSYVVTCSSRPLLKEKVKFELQMERNLEKEIKHENVPDTALSARLSSVYCAIDHEQFWLIRGVLDSNAGETIPEFPQPTAFLQPSKEQTVLTGNVYTGLSMDFYLNNVSIELLRAHKSDPKDTKSLGRLDFVKSQLSYRAFSDSMKTTNLSCEAFRGHDTRYLDDHPRDPSSVFTTILGPMESRLRPVRSSMSSSKLQFELFYRTGPGFVEFTALLNNMRVYLIVDWLTDMSKYLVENPHQERSDYLKSRTAQLMAQYGQVASGNQRKLDSSGQLLPEEQCKEVKMNFTNTEFVLVEDTSRLDSDGIILRSTAVLDYFPDRSLHPKSRSLTDYLTKPVMSCSLQSLEVFSCQLIKENETALSIIDPVTINFEVRPMKQTDLSQEEILADASLLDKSLLDVQASQLNIRVSYNDVMLFMNIFKSLTRKVNVTEASSRSTEVKEKAPNRVQLSYDTVEMVEPLMDIGYSYDDVVDALTVNGGSVERAGAWLVENAKLQDTAKPQTSGSSPSSSSKLASLKLARLCLSAEVVRLCLIDDCADDCDIPLTEMAVRNLVVRQSFSECMTNSVKDLMIGQKGSATFHLSGDYYNRMLSLWEPFLEPWRCNVAWRHSRGRFSSSPGKWNIEMQASDRFDITVTSALIETVKKTSSTWLQDYERVNDLKKTSLARKRLPLVAYVLRNLTGSSLRFATQTTALREGNMMAAGTRPKPKHVKNWENVYPGEDITFNFATNHEKLRHKRSDSLKLHQIIVQVEMYKVFQPVTVSKVGVYFRHAFKQINNSSGVFEPSVPVRVVFSVTLEGNAQKVVTVRSGLTLRSRVKIPIQLQLSHDNDDHSTLPILESGETQYMPLCLTSCSIRVRPSITSHSIPSSFNYSSTPIRWQSATSDKTSAVVECSSTVNNQPPFYFAVFIEKHPYPSYEEVSEMLSSQGEDNPSSDWKECFPHLPGHTIIILPPVVISNLLPCDLSYYIRSKDIEGTLKPGVDATPHAVHVSTSNQSSLIIGCLIDGFQSCRELVIPAVAKNFQMRMLIRDFSDQTLILNVRVLWRLGCSVKVSIMAGYWIVNKTGLPIVVKQEGCHQLAAGQYDSHEQARSMQPLLFSYANRESPYLCTMRLGKKARLEDLSIIGGDRLNGIPSFCERFSTDGGSCTRNLKLITRDGTPNREFCIGISVRRGWGRYLHTHIVTIAPRFLLINRTQTHRLSFAQRHTISYRADSSGINCHLTIIPGSSCVFHWPRVDLDTLLCVRLADEPSCHWSGGFFIDRTDAFHIALRVVPAATSSKLHPLAPHCIFLTVEVTLVNATYCVLVGDADPTQVPPPLRIDNVSFAPIIFKQVGTDASYNTEVPAGTQLAYACDEPCLQQKINCSVRGDSSHVDMNMEVIGEEKQLYYKNYFYIVMGSGPNRSNRDPLRLNMLVLDVQKNHKSYNIVLQPLRSGKRSQLWRMNSDGRIFHEGSSPPENDFSTSYDTSHSTRTAGLVLDIAEMAVNVGHSFDSGIPLTLKPFDERRRSTQTWNFCDDHRLKCRHKGLSVQVCGLSAGQPVVLALYSEQRVSLPTEMCHLQKLIPGSGLLSVKVVRDGPTRVLRIVDIRQKRAGISRSEDWTILESDSLTSIYHSAHSDISRQTTLSTTTTVKLTVNMQQGMGISLISNAPEELLYLTMNGINIVLSADSSEQTLLLTMQKLQIDNQLMDGYPPVMLHPSLTNSPLSTRSSKSHHASVTGPLVSIRAVRQPTSSRIYEIYKSLSIDIGRLVIALEERLILKLFHFMGFNPASSTHDAELLDETKLDSALSVTNLLQANRYTTVKRYYFDTLLLSAAPMRLSVFTASRLTPELKALKQALAFPLIQFERAPVALQDYAKRHLFETMAFILADLSKHVREQLKSQAAIILGSIDFLGNPIGLLSDVKAGIHAGLGQGNVQNMTKHITHGLSNTTAKFTGALSDKIGGLAMDEEYEDRRKAIQANARSSAGGHVVAGLQGLMAGVVGGLTSVVTQPVKGAQNDGASGFFKGVLKGVVGTVTKPVAGVLDLASESASAVRHMSVSPDQVAMRARPIRCCHSFQGCLQHFSKSQADGQTFLYAVNANDYNEHFYSCDNLNFSGGDNVLVLITNKKVYFVKNGEPDADHIMLSVDYSDLVGVSVIGSDKTSSPSSSRIELADKIYLELVMKSTSPTAGYLTQVTSGARYHTKKPRVACHSSDVADRVCQQIQYAKNLASEQTETMQCDPDEEVTRERAFELEV